MARKRVVITGMGMLTPLGNSVEETWSGISSGKNGISDIEHFDVSAYSTRFGGSIKNFNVEEYIPLKETKKMDTFIHYGMAASIQAIKDAGLDNAEESLRKRIGVAVGSGIGGISFIENGQSTVSSRGPRRLSPFVVPGCIINMISGHVGIKYGFYGPNIAITTACTTGTHNIGYAARTIAYGDADIMVAGGAEMATTPVGLGGFAAARALSTRNDDPAKASRPWDKDRDGFVLSDGAGVLVLEELESAKSRGAKIYAELTGFGMSDDGFHITSPPEDGSGAAASMEAALNDAGIPASEVSYINAHGTSTPVGDLAETKAVKKVFGDQTKVAVSSTKSMIGHLLGAAGAVEAIFCVKAIQDNLAPPTINLENPSEGCDLDYVPTEARSMEINYALSNSFGFGGTNGTLVFKKY